MLRANALFIVVVIALVIGILCSSLIVVAYYQRLQIQKDLSAKRIDLNANSAINILLSGTDDFQYDETRSLDLFGEDRDSVTIKKILWGIFEIGSVNSFSGRMHKDKAIMYGYQPDDLTNSAIYLADQNSQLALGGTTTIKGECYLPESGVKRAYIEGQAFSGINLIDGEVKKSEPVLPPLNKIIVDKLAAFFEISKENLGENFELYSGETRDTIIRSYNEKTLIINSSNPLSLKGKKYIGNIIVCSDKLIEIDSSSKISDILIFAAAVKVGDYFKGNLQIFATDSIVTGQHCYFEYPSAMGMFKKDFKVMQPFIEIGNNSRFNGILFSYRLVQDLQQTLIAIEKDTEVEGQIYSDGFVDLKGNVFGNVTCNKFTLRTPSSIYENHLLNVTIDNSKLSPYFIGSSIISSNKKKKVIKWLQ